MAPGTARGGNNVGARANIAWHDLSGNTYIRIDSRRIAGGFGESGG